MSTKLTSVSLRFSQEKKSSAEIHSILLQLHPLGPAGSMILTSNLMVDNVQKTFYAIVNVTLKPSSNSIIWHSHQQYNTRLWICTYWLETWMLLMNVIACLRSKTKDYRYFYCFSLSTITLFNWPSSSSLPNIWEDNVIHRLLQAWGHQIKSLNI